MNRFLRWVRRLLGRVSGKKGGRDDGAGVPVPVRPRPWRDGAQAQAPESEDEAVLR